MTEEPEVPGSPQDQAPSQRRPRLLDQVRHAARLRHMSPRTELSYVGWIRRFILFHDKRHPKDMGAAEVVAFLTHLACISHQVSAAAANLFAQARETGARLLDVLPSTPPRPDTGFSRLDSIFTASRRDLVRNAG